MRYPRHKEQSQHQKAARRLYQKEIQRCRRDHRRGYEGREKMKEPASRRAPACTKLSFSTNLILCCRKNNK